jgi:hypothetical protein
VDDSYAVMPMEGDVPDEDLVMRSVFLRVGDDNELRQLAHEKRVTKNDLIRSAVAAKLKEWRQKEGTADKDLQLGKRSR